MFWPHTKTLVPAEAGYEFFVEMSKLPFAEHKITFTTNSVPCIITPPLFGKRQKLRLLNDLKATDAHPFDPSVVLKASFFRSGQNLHRNKLHCFRLYQISHLPVKENLSKQSQKYFCHLP